MNFSTAELQRRLENVIRIGVIAKVDYDNKKIRVQSGELLSNWLAWPVEMGRNFKRWRPLRLGQQVILGSPSADPAQAVVIGMLYSQNFEAPSDDPDLDLIAFDNGASLSHNIDTGEMNVVCKGEIKVSADKDITINSAQTVTVIASQAINMLSGGGVMHVKLGGYNRSKMDGESQVVSEGKMLIKSDTSLVLKGPRRTIVL